MPATSLSPSILAIMLLGSAIALMGQTPSTGRISGSVKDPTGGAAPNAQVTATSQTSKAARTTLTDANGQFVFESLAPGAYTVKVEIPGFKLFEQTGVAVGTDLSIVLQISEAASGGSITSVILNTLGWIDRRGKDI